MRGYATINGINILKKPKQIKVRKINESELSLEDMFIKLN